MELQYKLESFEGPLDLLLHLIEKNKVNIYDIPIAKITEQYMDDSVDQSWSGGKGTAERGLVYGFMVIVAWLGIVFVRYFLRQE